MLLDFEHILIINFTIGFNLMITNDNNLMITPSVSTRHIAKRCWIVFRDGLVVTSTSSNDVQVDWYMHIFVVCEGRIYFPLIRFGGMEV